MRFLHVADLHIGKRLNGMALAADQRHMLAQIVRIACERQVDALLIAGDIYDKAAPSAEAVMILDRFLADLSAAGVRVLAVPGNHDSAERIAFAHGLLAAQGVSFPPVFDGQVERVTLKDEEGSVNVWLLPFLKPADVRRFFPDRQIGDDFAEALSAVLEACPVDMAQRNVIVSHQLVTAGGVGPDRADDEIRLGGVDNVDVAVYDAFDYVALGHVHRAQRVGRDTVRYAGSPLKYSFSEARFDKKAVLVDLGSKRAGDAVGECVSLELIPLVPLHDMREVRMSLDELLRRGRAAREALAGEDGGAPGGDEVDAQATGGGAADAQAAGGGAADAPGGDEADDAQVGATREDTRYDGSSTADGDASDVAQACDFLEDYLHITLTDEHPQMDAMQRIRELFPNAMTLDYDNAFVLAARAEARTAPDPSTMDMMELFARFYEEQAGVPLDDAQRELVAAKVRAVSAEVARSEKSAPGEEETSAGKPARKGKAAGRTPARKGKAAHA